MNAIEWIINDHERMLEGFSVTGISKENNEQATKEYEEIIHILSIVRDYIDATENTSSEVSVYLDKDIVYRIMKKLVSNWWGDLL